MVTIEVKGRNRYADNALTEISIRDHRYSGYHGEIMKITGGYIEQRDGSDTFVIAAKHMTATDEDHDSSYVAMLEGAGLKWDHMMGPNQYFTGVILEAQFYTEEPTPEGKCGADWCDEKHGFLDFTPPTQKWVPGLYEITIRYGVSDDE